MFEETLRDIFYIVYKTFYPLLIYINMQNEEHFDLEDGILEVCMFLVTFEVSKAMVPNILGAEFSTRVERQFSTALKTAKNWSFLG